MDELSRLVERAQRGDVAAFEQIVRSFQRMAVAYSYAQLGDRHLAEDVAQEAFTEAFFALPALREPLAFAGWLRRIIFKHCDRITRRRRAPTVPLAAAALVAAQISEPAQAAENRELRAEIAAAIGALPEHERVVTALFYIGEYSQQEIAAFLEVSINAVRKRLQSARGKLKERMMHHVQTALHDQGASLDERFAQTVTIAIEAVKAGDVAALRRLLSASPDLVQARSADGRSLLGHLTDYPANIQGGIELVRELVAAGASVDALALDGALGETPLQWAVSANDVAVAAALLDAGAAVDGVGGDRRPLAQALFYRQREAADLLVDRGAQIDLEFASGLGQLDIIERCFDADGRLNELAGAHHQPINTAIPPESAAPQAELLAQALVYAAINGQVEAAALLLARGAPIDALPSGFDIRMTALHWAVMHRQAAMVTFLAAQGADLAVRDPQYDATPLGWARYHHIDAIAELLSQHGARA